MSNVPAKLQPWIEARKKYSLTHEQIQMARELGLKPSGLDKLAVCGLRENQSLAECIAETYLVRFKKDHPDDVRSIEERLVDRKIRKNLKEGKFAGIVETASSLRFRLMKYLSRQKSPDKKKDAEGAVPSGAAAPGNKEGQPETAARQKQSEVRSEAEVVAKFWTSLTGLK